jgi:hypothetical protein
MQGLESKESDLTGPESPSLRPFLSQQAGVTGAGSGGSGAEARPDDYHANHGHERLAF